MTSFGPNKVNNHSDISRTTSQELKFSEFSYFNDTYKWCKNEEILRGKGVFWMICYGIALGIALMMCMYLMRSLPKTLLDQDKKVLQKPSGIERVK